MYRCSKNSPKLPFPPLSGNFGAASGRDASLGKALQHHEIGHDRCSAGPSQNRVGMGAPKLPHQFPLVVHYLRKAGCHHLPIAHWSIPPLLDRIPNKREFLARSLGALGVFRLLERISTRRWPALVVLTYHRIGSPGIKSNPYYDPWSRPLPRRFATSFGSSASGSPWFALKRLPGWVKRVWAPGRSRRRLSRLMTAIEITSRQALPILRELDVPAAFFIPTGFLQAPRLPWWDHVAYAIKQTRSPRLTLHREPGDTAPLIIELGPEPSDQVRTEAIMAVIRAFLDGAVHDETWFLAQLDRQVEVGIDPRARGGELFMDWGQVRQLASSGMSIGSHGHSHVAPGGLVTKARCASWPGRR